MAFEASIHLRDALIVFFVAALPSVAWFFRMRKLMLARQVIIIRRLEGLLKPRDKRYWVLGYLVGFTGKYWIYRGPIARVTVTYTTPPYHAFFYLPVIALGRRKERLDIEVESRYKLGFNGIAHIYTPRIYSIRIGVEKELKDRGGAALASKELNTGGRKYKVYYNSDDALSIAKSIMDKLAGITEVYRISVDSDKRRIIASIAVKGVDIVEDAVRTVVGAIEELSTGERS